MQSYWRVVIQHDRRTESILEIGAVSHTDLRFKLPCQFGRLELNIAGMAEPSWQELLRLRLTERNAKESSYAPIIEQCTFFPWTLDATARRYIHKLIQRDADRRLAQQTKLLKERNASLLKAVGSVRANPSSSTVYVPGTGGELVPLPSVVFLFIPFLTIVNTLVILSKQHTWPLSNHKYRHFEMN
jgi:hypothetical protein